MKSSRIFLLILIISLGALVACLALFFGSSGCGSDSGFTTGERTVMSNDVERVYYLKLPADYATAKTLYPLFFAFHGTGGDYTSYTEDQSYGLHDVVGEEAILVYPNALLNDNDVAQWDYDTDIPFFDDLYQELEANICFDKRKVFATGISSGGGITHTLGCMRGNILRAIAPVAGSLLDHENCIGQVAVIQIQGANDDIVPIGTTTPGRDYWIAVNSCDKGESGEGVDPVCVAYEKCDAKFPVQYCEHEGGHIWPDFASDAMWNFFKSLPPAMPSDKTGEDVEDLGKGTINFKIHYPADFVGTPDIMALAMYPPDTTQPLYVAPSYILNTNVPIGDYQFGEIIEYNNVEINLLGVEYGDYTLSVVIYVAGGTYPIPTTGQDYVGLQNFTLDSDIVTVEEPFELEFLESF